MITNGLGGYASGTLIGVPSRRSHGLLIAALPAPLGRTLMLNHLVEERRLDDGSTRPLASPDRPPGRALLNGRPHWRLAYGDVVLEKSIVMPHRQNTTHVSYRLLPGSAPIALVLEPAFDIRPHQGPVAGAGRFKGVEVRQGVEITSSDERFPPVRLAFRGVARPAFTRGPRTLDIAYEIERARGDDWQGQLQCIGSFEVRLGPGEELTFVVSTEGWEQIEALSPEEARTLDDQRRLKLIAAADPRLRDGIGAELVLAADQFVITPRTRPQDEVRGAAEGDGARTIIAGYPWFTDWGRDTMISLEGLTLATGRHEAARDILLTFARHIRDGLIPNLFPEGENEGLYHTADATLWFFHALDRYESQTGDVETRRLLLPRLVDIIARHIAGTRFGIGVDPADGLLREGAAGLQLTWMDAKVGDWVVTPRRGKPVEINALYYNALRLLEGWLRDAEAQGTAAGPDDINADAIARRADAVYAAFNQRFWYAAGGYLFDVVDTEAGGDDASFRPNQILALSLPHPVLEPGPLAAGVTAGHRPAGDAVRPAVARSRTSRLQGALRRRHPRPGRRLSSGDGVGVVGRPVRRRVAARLSGRPDRRAPSDRGPRARAARGLHRDDQRNLRRGAALHPTRLLRPGLERRRSATRHSPHRPPLRLITASGPIATVCPRPA